MNRTKSLLVAALLAAVTLPTEIFAQAAKNLNLSRRQGSVVVGGRGNLIASNSTAAFIGGGMSNNATNSCVTIGGGLSNTVSGAYATVGGGYNNAADNDRATVAGGEDNDASALYATVGGGFYNLADGGGSAVGGGEDNRASGIYATVAGGYDNHADGAYSFAAGRKAKALEDGQFVWADSQPENYYGNWADRKDTFSVRAQGGVTFSDGGNPELEMYWKPDKNDWTYTSDKEAKENFCTVDAREVLKHVASLPITEWSYKGYSRRNIGPMAQDWRRAFPSLSESDKAINSGDVQGVSLAAIQGLVEELKERDKTIEELKQRSAEVEQLKAKLEAFEKRLDSLPPASAR